MIKEGRKLVEPWECDEEVGYSEKRTPLDDKIEEQLLEKRIIVINGELREAMVDKVCKRLIHLGTLNKKKVKIILNSVGGEVYLGLLIYNTIVDLKRSKIPIEIETRGLAASMGCIILQAGSKRLASKYTRFLIHEISTFTFGKTSEVKEAAEETIKLNNMLREILAERSGKTPEEIEELWHKRDVWMSAKEALAFGLIDKIV